MQLNFSNAGAKAMYNQRNKEFNPTIFVPGLTIYVDLAEGIIAIFSRIGSFLKSLAYGVIGK